MPDASYPDASHAGDRQQDPRVAQLRPDPSQPPPGVQTLQGLWGNSDRPGFRRLYFTGTLDFYAEFRVDDVLSAGDIPADQAPFLGEQATRVTLRQNAAVDITHTRRAASVDEFDIDVRFKATPAVGGGEFEPTDGQPICLACGTMGDATCGPNTPGTCAETCQTCLTHCGTCETCDGHTDCGTCGTCDGATDCGTCTECLVG